MKLSSKSSGERAELLFAAECYKYGISPLFPHTDDLNYDFAIDNGNNILRVQVKSSRYKSNIKSSYQFTINYKKKSKYKLDYYAFYCYEQHVFYIVPAKSIKSNAFYASKANEMYKNAWHLLKS